MMLMVMTDDAHLELILITDRRSSRRSSGRGAKMEEAKYIEDEDEDAGRRGHRGVDVVVGIGTGVSVE